MLEYTISYDDAQVLQRRHRGAGRARGGEGGPVQVLQPGHSPHTGQGGLQGYLQRGVEE